MIISRLFAMDCFKRRSKKFLMLWLIFAVNMAGCAIGLLSLALSASASPSFDTLFAFKSYFSKPLILFLNLLPPTLLLWLFTLLSGRAWVGFLISFFFTIGASLINYYKIRLRSDPFLAADLTLFNEAINIVRNYTLDFTLMVQLTLGSFLIGLLLSMLLIPKVAGRHWLRLAGVATISALAAVSFQPLYLADVVYQKAENPTVQRAHFEAENYLARGGVYSFLHSFNTLSPTPPHGYDKETAAALLADYSDSDIPEDRKVSVVGIMLEAFSDLTDLPYFAEHETALEVYAPWHKLEESSITGNLITNVFGAGTAYTEWSFLSGESFPERPTKNTDSYVRYFKEQGYQCFGSHPYYPWFYNRQNVNRFYGFDEYHFTEEIFGSAEPPGTVYFESDHLFVDRIVRQIEERSKNGPCFSFSVTLQNHGPYDYDSSYFQHMERFLPDQTGLSNKTCNALNNYFHVISDTIDAMTVLTENLEALSEPIVLILFGDHKPQGGSGNYVYNELGVNLDISTLEGMYNYHATPYLIWANSTAKHTLGNDFIGDGSDFSPSMLMIKLFDLCGWEGPSFMKLSREMRDISPLVHGAGWFLKDGQLIKTLTGNDAEFFRQYRGVEFYRKTHLQVQ